MADKLNSLKGRISCKKAG